MMKRSAGASNEPRFARRWHRAIVSSILVLVCAECSLGYWARYRRTPFESWDRERATPVLIPGRYRTPHGLVEIDESGFVARTPSDSDQSEAASGRSGFRILALGDSCTFGAGDATSTFPAALERRLASRQPGPSKPSSAAPIVVNAGIAGLRSDEAIGRLAYALTVVHPNVVTIYLGWNDLMKSSPRAQARTGPGSGLWWALDELWLVRGLRKLLFVHLRARFGAPRTGGDGETHRFARFRPSYFEANLHRLVADTRTAGARPLLVTLPHSLRRDLSPMDLLAPPRQYPYFYGGNALGDFLDLIDRYNETIRRVGAVDGVPVADVADRFDRITHKVDYFLDTMHPNPRGNVLIAEVIERSLRDRGVLDRPASAVDGGVER